MKCLGKKFKIILVGDGPLKEEINRKVKENKLEDNIVFLGVRDDIPLLLKTFDIFLFPSFYEGLPLVLVEAQAAGVFTLASDTITQEVDLGVKGIKFLSIKDNIGIWIDNLCEKRKLDIYKSNERKKIIESKGYDVKCNIKNVMDLYEV